MSDGTHSENAQLLFASPAQITFVMPASIQPGMSMVTVSVNGLVDLTSNALVTPVAPTLFSADGTGTGVAAAIGIRKVISTHLQGPVQVFACDPANALLCRAVPIDVGIDAPVTLKFFGTGIRHGSAVTATIGGQSVPVTFFGPQPDIPGVDQVNLPLILSLRGAGLVDVVVTVDGLPSNPVQVAIQ